MQPTAHAMTAATGPVPPALELNPDPAGAIGVESSSDLASRTWRLERCLARHPGVVAVAVVARPHRSPWERSMAAGGGTDGLPPEQVPVLAAFVSPAPYQVLERAALEAWVRDALPGAAEPVTWFQMQRLPRAPSGEVLRDQLARWWLDGLLLPLGD